VTQLVMLAATRTPALVTAALKLATSESIDRVFPFIAAKPCLGTRTGEEFWSAYPWSEFPADRNDNPPLSLDLENVGR
jgi:hypothetical protein